MPRLAYQPHAGPQAVQVLGSVNPLDPRDIFPRLCRIPVAQFQRWPLRGGTAHGAELGPGRVRLELSGSTGHRARQHAAGGFATMLLLLAYESVSLVNGC